MTDLIVVPQAAHWQRLKCLVLDSVSSPITRRVYNLGLDEFFESSTASYNGAAVTSKWKANWDAAPPSESSFRGPNPNRHLRRVREKKRPSFVGVGNRSATLGPGAIYMTLGTANARLDSHPAMAQPEDRRDLRERRDRTTDRRAIHWDMRPNRHRRTGPPIPSFGRERRPEYLV